jgi:hypothetical protein
MWSGANSSIEGGLEKSGYAGDTGLTALTAALGGITKGMSDKKAAQYQREKDALIAEAAESGNPLAYILAGGDKEFGGKWADTIVAKERLKEEQEYNERLKAKEWEDKNRQWVEQLNENKRQHNEEMRWKWASLGAGKGGNGKDGLSEIQQDQLKWLNSNQKDLTPEQYQNGLDAIKAGSFDIGNFERRGKIRQFLGADKFAVKDGAQAQAQAQAAARQISPQERQRDKQRLEQALKNPSLSAADRDLIEQTLKNIG